jgi:SAM-dependent methyltransferase
MEKPKVILRLTKFILKQNFQPTWVGIFFNPFFLIRYYLFKNIKSLSRYISGDLMDFGCGRKPYENLFNVTKYVGVDVKISGHDHLLSKIDVYYDGITVPLPTSTFDSVVCFEVLEHVFNPTQILPELNRVLKTGGKFLLSVPFCWNEHEVPYDYARYSSFGIKHLLESNGFRVIELCKSGNFNLVILQLRILYLFELFKRLGRLGYFFTLFFSVPLAIWGLFISSILPADKSLYFNTIVIAEKI